MNEPWRHLATFVTGPNKREQQANVSWSDGLPLAQCDSCEFYDGKRCSLQGMRPQAICEPVVQRMSEMLDARTADTSRLSAQAQGGK